MSLLASDATLLMMVSPLSIHGGLLPEEGILPFVLVRDTVENPFWYHETSRIEKHTIVIEVHAQAAAPPADPEDGPPAVPAEAILDQIESLLDWEDLLTSDQTVTPIRVERRNRERQVLTQRNVPALRVIRCAATWEIEIGVDV